MSDESSSEQERVAALKRRLGRTDERTRLELVEIVMEHLEVEHAVLTDDACLVTLGMDGLFVFEIFQDVIDTFEIEEQSIRTTFGDEIFNEDAFAIATTEKAFKAKFQFGKILAFVIRETDAHLRRILAAEDADRSSIPSSAESAPVANP